MRICFISSLPGIKLKLTRLLVIFIKKDFSDTFHQLYLNTKKHYTRYNYNILGIMLENITMKHYPNGAGKSIPVIFSPVGLSGRIRVVTKSALPGGI